MNRQHVDTNSIKAILFDFGGTLDSDGVSWKERFYPLCRSAGLPWSMKEFEKYFYASDDYLTEKKLKNVSYSKMLRMQISLVLKNGKSYHRTLMEKILRSFRDDSMKVIDRNLKLLKHLKQHYRLGIISNFYGNLMQICKETGLSRFLDVVVDSANVGCIKPDPRIFFCALDQLKLSPEQVIFVGDSVSRDMQGARKIGMPHVWLKNTNSKGVRRCCPKDRVIHSLVELEEILL